jgi:tetratricopeptide (TPR) repeat protein
MHSIRFLILGLAAIASAQHLEQGKQAFEAGNYQKAIELFEQAQEQSQQCEVLFYIGVARYRLNDLDSAIISFQSAASCDSNLFEAHVALAESYTQKGNYTQALLSYEEALRVQPNHPGVLRAASALYTRHQLNDKALPLLQRLVALKDDDPSLRADLGALYGAMGDLESASEQFQKALDLQPDNPSALTGAANLRLKQGDFEEAIELLQQAIKVVPEAHDPRFLLGSAYNRAQRFEEAVSELQTAVRLGGNDPEIYYHLARAYGRLGRPEDRDRALARFSEIKRQSSREADIRREAAKLLDEAKAFLSAGDLARASELVEKSHTLNPSNPETVFRLASLQFDLRRYDVARQYARQATEMAPSDWRSHYLLGLIEMTTDNLPEARASLEVAARLNPTAAEVQNELGNIALASEDPARAVRYYERAVELAPANEPYKANLEGARGAEKAPP